MMQSTIVGEPFSQMTVGQKKQSLVQPEQQSPAVLSLEAPKLPESPTVDTWMTMPSSTTVRTVAANVVNQVADALPVVTASASAAAVSLQNAGLWFWQALQDSYVSKPEEPPLQAPSGIELQPEPDSSECPKSEAPKSEALEHWEHI